MQRYAPCVPCLFGYGREIVSRNWYIGSVIRADRRTAGPSDLDGQLNRESGVPWRHGQNVRLHPKCRTVAFATGSWRQHLVHGPSICWPKANGIACCWRDRQVIDVPISDASANNCGVDVDGAFVAMERGLGIRLGNCDQMRESVWKFSLKLYDRPGISDLLIGLQDEQSVDVNLVLFLYWCGRRDACPLTKGN